MLWKVDAAAELCSLVSAGLWRKKDLKPKEGSVAVITCSVGLSTMMAQCWASIFGISLPEKTTAPSKDSRPTSGKVA